MAKRAGSESKSEPPEKHSQRSSGFTSDSKDLKRDKSDLLSDLDSPPVASTKKSKTATESRGAIDASKVSQNAVESFSKVAEKNKSSKRYRDSNKEDHPAGSYCSSTKHEAGNSKCLPVEQLKALMAQAQARANEGEARFSNIRQENKPQMAQSVHIAQNVDFRNLDNPQGNSIKYQESKYETFNPQTKQIANSKLAGESKNTESPETARTSLSSGKSENNTNSESAKSSESSTAKTSKTSRSFSSPEYQIHQESLDFYQAHKKAFKAADERFQKLPEETLREPTSVHDQKHQNELSRGDRANSNQTRPLQNRRIERIDPYYALNYQLAKENSLFNPPQQDYRVKSIDRADPIKHPDALALDIPESRILDHIPAHGAQDILKNAEHAVSGIPLRVGEVLDAVEAMMEQTSEDNSSSKHIDYTDENNERRLIMLLDGKHKGLLFPVKKLVEPPVKQSTIGGITKIFLPNGEFKFVKVNKASGKFNMPDLKGLINKIKAKVSGKVNDNFQSKETAQKASDQVFPQTIVSPQQTGTIVIKDLKPGTAEPEPLASQLTKSQKSKQEEAKKQETKETRPESKTGNKDPYQGRLPEIKMSYTKSQQSTKDFTKLRPNEKPPVKESGEVKEPSEAAQATRIRDIYAKFDIQLPRKKLRPEITESGTYKIISNQTSQKLPAMSEDKLNAPYEVASIFEEEDQFPGGDPRNPENQPLPKIAATANEEPRKSYVVKQGETIEYIAVAELHEAALAPLIREINAILLQQFFDHEKQEEVTTMPAGVMILLPNKKDIIAFRLRIARNRQ